MILLISTVQFLGSTTGVARAMGEFLDTPESLPAERRQPFVLAEASPVAALRGLAALKGVGALVFVVGLSGLAQYMTHTSWVLYTTFKFGWGPQENGWCKAGCWAGCSSAGPRSGWR